MTNAVDTSKEAVERFAAPFLFSTQKRAAMEQKSHGAWVRYEDYATLLAERDQLRREVEEARDKALEEAKAEILKRSAGNEEGYVEWFDDRPYVCEESAYRRIEAIKARP